MMNIEYEKLCFSKWWAVAKLMFDSCSILAPSSSVMVSDQ